MGEAKRKEEAAAGEKRVIAICPVCKKEFIADGESRLIVNSYMIAMGQLGNQIQMGASLPKIVCTNCGVEFFAGDALTQIQKRSRGEVPNIIVPETRVKLN